jgi:GT2 family glycosyltransferase
LFSTVESDNGQYDRERDVFWATGAAMMTRRDLFEEMDGLDERLYMHMEEIDYCWRLKRRGFRIVCQPMSWVFHIGAASLEQGSAEKVFLNYRNNLLILFKNLPARAWTGIILRRFVLDGLGMLRALLLLRPRESFAILRAYWAAHRMKVLFRTERPAAAEPTVLPSYRGNIVWDYFIRRRILFSELHDQRFKEL